MNARLPILKENEAAQEAAAKVAFAGNAHVITLGCSKNRVDSEVMTGVLQNRGFRIVPEPLNADLILVNTCSFLTAAVEESIETILEMSRMKTEGRCRRLIVAGCLVERYKSKLENELPEVDRFVSTDELLNVADEGATTDDCLYEARRPYFLYDEAMPRTLSTAPGSAYVKISEGCDRPCSFCIIPKIRGAFRSRSVASITEEIKQMTSAGVREVNLVAQDLTAYGNDFEDKGATNLSALLSNIETTLGDAPYWLRLFYAYPIGVNDQLLDQIVKSKHIVNYLDMPLQHVSKSVLKAMRRPLGEKGTRALIEKIHAGWPEIALRTTFIVGFPGETEEDVESLAEFIRQGYFEHVGVFTYSDEEESGSFDLPDRIDEDEKIERRDYLMSVQQEVVEKRNLARVGTRVKVFIEGYSPETELLLSARAEFQGPEADGTVLINDFDDEIDIDTPAEEFFGRFATVEITEVVGYDLVGMLCEVE